MKKRMFITTIVMMLVLAIALTTSSLAWFSSANRSVTASSATFYATTEGKDNVSLKISKTTGSWDDKVNLLTSGTKDAGTMIGVIPTEPLVPTTGTAPAFTGTENQSQQPVSVTHPGYIWPGDMTFNSAKINVQTSKFVIDEQNPVNTYTNFTKETAAGVYYDTFFLFNADKQNDINSLTFKLSNDTELTVSGNDGADYACKSYVAIFIYDLAQFSANDVVTTNALSATSIGAYDANRGKTIRANDYDGEFAEATDYRLALNETTYYAWVPFAAFTFEVKREGQTGAEWQYADFDAPYYEEIETAVVGTEYIKDKNDSETITFEEGNTEEIGVEWYNGLATKPYKIYKKYSNWNDQLITVPSTFATKGTSGKYDTTTSFTLDTTNLKALNGQSGTADNNSEFVMHAGEIFLVSMYAWLDGYSMTEYTDTTVLKVGLNISAAK